MSASCLINLLHLCRIGLADFSIYSLFYKTTLYIPLLYPQNIFLKDFASILLLSVYLAFVLATNVICILLLNHCWVTCNTTKIRTLQGHYIRFLRIRRENQGSKERGKETKTICIISFVSCLNIFLSFFLFQSNIDKTLARKCKQQANNSQYIAILSRKPGREGGKGRECPLPYLTYFLTLQTL